MSVLVLYKKKHAKNFCSYNSGNQNTAVDFNFCQLVFTKIIFTVTKSFNKKPSILITN